MARQMLATTNNDFLGFIGFLLLLIFADKK